MPIPGVREAARRILAMKRTLDILAHYDAMDFAFLLPHTDAAGAGIFASRVFKLLTETPVLADVDPKNIELFFGIASTPQHADKPGRLLALANQSRLIAKQTATAIVCAE